MKEKSLGRDRDSIADHKEARPSVTASERRRKRRRTLFATGATFVALSVSACSPHHIWGSDSRPSSSPSTRYSTEPTSPSPEATQKIIVDSAMSKEEALRQNPDC